MRLRFAISVALTMAVLLFADTGQARSTGGAAPFGVGVACAQLDACLYQMNWHCTHGSHGHYNYCPDGWCHL
jgi:hypothetical protein